MNEDPVDAEPKATNKPTAFPIEVHRISVWPDGTERPCVYRYASETCRDQHLVEEARVLRDRTFNERSDRRRNRSRPNPAPRR